MSLFRAGHKPVIGMVHAPALPGAPRAGLPWNAGKTAVSRDAEALAQGGVDAIIIENYGDAPFFPGRVPAHTVSHLTALALEVKRVAQLPLGINMLRNDGVSAIAVAAAAGAAFIRVNILTGARVTDQGIIQGIAHDLLRERALLGANAIAVFADVNVKHSAPLAARAEADEVSDLLHRGGADAVIVSGAGTGKPTDLDELRRVKAAAGASPVLVGSGVTEDTLASLWPAADGFIVGTCLKKDGRVGEPVDAERVKRLMARARGA
mgnify:CR=1 FL=1